MKKKSSDGSEYIVSYKSFLDSIDTYKYIYDFCISEMEKCDKETQDWLHQIELGSYKERDKSATALSHVRKKRRRYKDTCELLEPMIKLLSTKEGDYFIKQLREVLGATRKQKRNMENRQYYPRVVSKLEISNHKNNNNKGD